MKVITKIAITTVPIRDCRELIRSDPKLLVVGCGGAGVGSTGAGEEPLVGGATGSLAAATSTDGSTWFGKAAGSVCETVGWLRESMKILLIHRLRGPRRLAFRFLRT